MGEGPSGDLPLFGADAAKLGRQMVLESIEYDTVEVVSLLRDAWSDAAITRWLVSINSDLDGESPIEVLRANNLPAVMDAAALALAGGDLSDATHQHPAQERRSVNGPTGASAGEPSARSV